MVLARSYSGSPRAACSKSISPEIWPYEIRTFSGRRSPCRSVWVCASACFSSGMLSCCGFMEWICSSSLMIWVNVSLSMFMAEYPGTKVLILIINSLKGVM